MRKAVALASALRLAFSVLLIFLAASARAADGDVVPPPPEAPPLPPVLTEGYYATCGGIHVPIQPLAQRTTEEVGEYVRYRAAREYQRYVEELSVYGERYRGLKETAAAAEEESKGAKGEPAEIGSETPLGGPEVKKVGRDPKHDLARWLRGSLYHQGFLLPVYGGEGETAVSLEEPDAGPAPSSSLYGNLLAMLDLENAAGRPGPKQMLEGLEALWQARWRRALGFESDPTCRLLAASLDRAAKATAQAQARVGDVQRRVDEDPGARSRLQQQLAFSEKELAAAQEREAELRVQFERRRAFVDAITLLLRMAPDGGFGPAFDEVPGAVVQGGATKILVEIGPMAGAAVWKGLAADLAWIERYAKSGASRESAMLQRHVRGALAAEELLRDRRVDGLATVCDVLVAGEAADAVVLRKAFELVDILGTRELNADVLRVLPPLLDLRRNPDEGVANRARLLLLRVLGLRTGRASIEDALGVLAPLVKDDDEELARATVKFLEHVTGQALGPDPKAWLKFQAHMAAERRKREQAVAK
ncbi:MAG: hypothetical protein L6R28_18240 [Planctomycetes bacterium]|nr:hypothetical protein [Planctomycetota bacterium]